MSPDAAQLRAASRDWPSLTVQGEAAAVLELMLRGALGATPRFMTRAEAEAAGDAALVLPAAASCRTGERVALRDREGLMLAALLVEENWQLAGRGYVAGPVTGVQLPPHYSFGALRHSADELRGNFDAAFLADEPIHRATFEALMATGHRVLVIGALPPDADPGDTYPTVRCWLHAVEASGGRLGLSLWPLPAPESPHGHFLADAIARGAGCR